MDQQLKVFIAVAECQSFSQAAAQLHMTQSAVSQHIKSFEKQIGATLLERTNKYVRLNQAGEVVYQHALEITGLYGRMQRLVDDLTNHAAGPLKIGASYTFGEYALPPLIARLHRLYPDIEPDVTIGNTAHIVELVKNNQLDIGIVEGQVKAGRTLTIEEFAEDEMVIVGAHDHEGMTPDSDTLARQLWVCREPGSGTREAAKVIFNQFGITPARMMTFSSTQAIKQAVESGLGLTLLSKLAIQKEVESGTLKVIQVDGLPYKRAFSTVITSSFQTKALQEFLKLLYAKN
ncbi:LysR family transcriptional regulator [Jeotgalibacillus terrae]|uniref:LysR family transcriptional regulator n=1 Tax=Jeotgalibacillus terrae TaxID=587735 RepID=A0ABW5ZFH4_9BACL|nr:LysR family transcriptional regulator [Jeotgalibacillus terrae]MBM7579374.1 DNA-binding transcriptional LysR family regulator [Jeotgalibacillus terrae]